MKAMLEDPVVHTAALTNQVSRPKDTPMPHRTKPSSPQLPSAVNRRRGQGHRGYLATFQSNISSLKMRHGNHAEVITEKRAPQPQEEGSATGKHGQEPAEKGSQIEGDIPIHECEHSPTRRNPVTSNHFCTCRLRNRPTSTARTCDCRGDDLVVVGAPNIDQGGCEAFGFLYDTSVGLAMALT